MKNFEKNLSKAISEKLNIYKDLENKSDLIERISNIIYDKLKKGGKILFCGNGGSAADAQHLATEFLVRLKPKLNRHSIPSIALTLDPAFLTACGNDFGFENIFSRSLEGIGNKKDVLFAISTSGNSRNIIKALKKAKKMKIQSICLLGKNGGLAKKNCKDMIIVKSTNTARIQETHIFLGHTILEYVEQKLIKSKTIKLINTNFI